MRANLTAYLLAQYRTSLRIGLSSWLLMVLCATTALAQERTVTGTVTSAENGEALPGVNVVLKNTTIGTVTDIDGNYRLNVPAEGGILTYTFIGLQSKEVPIDNQSTINVILSEDVGQLNEVVVTALGIERTKNELPYAAQKVEGEAVSQQRDANFVNSLSGRVAGLNIKQNNSLGGSTNVTIRGNTSLTGNNQALFVIDGVPVDNSTSNSNGQITGRGNQQEGQQGYDYGNVAADINPDDIASINVLKGAAATALYGSRAANGVVMITTKKGAKGLGITINSGVTVGFIDKSTFPTYQKEYGAGYGAYYDPPTGYFLSGDANGDGADDLIVPFSEDASHGAAFDPNLQVYHWDAYDPSSPYYQKARPWVAAENDPSAFFETPVSNNQSIVIDGGNDDGYFKLGYTRADQRGILPNSKIIKNLINLGAGYNITEKLKVSAALNFSNIDGLGRYGTGYASTNLMGNFRQWWQTNVDVLELRDAYNRTGQNITWNWADPSDLRPIYWDNPYWTRYQNYQDDSRARYFGYTMVNYQITDWLSVMGRASLDSYNEIQEERLAVGSVDVSQYSRFDRSYREYNYDLLFNMNKDLSDNFNLQALLGGNIRRTEIGTVFQQTNGGLVVPGLYALSNSVNGLQDTQESETALEVDGIFAGATLGFRDMIFLDITGRRDQASSLPAGENVYYYPSVSTSFVFSELLNSPSSWFTYGKLRANYAEVGNTAPALSIVDTYQKVTIFNGNTIYSVDGTKNNPNLKPERTKSYEIGVETTFLDGKAGLDVTYYNARSVDQILPVTVSRATGYNERFVNAGEIKNTGFEVSAFATPVQAAAFSWTVNVNWSRNRNEVVSLFEDSENLQLGSFQGGVTINAAKGEPYGNIKGTDYVYDEATGQPIVGSNGLYLQTDASNITIGNSNPDWIGGVTNTIKYKGLSLNFLIDVRMGGDVFSLDQYYGRATGLYPETAGLNDLGNPVRAPLVEDAEGNVLPSSGGVILPGVKEDGTPNDERISAVNFGVFGYRRNPASAFVYDASFVKLRQLSLTYSFPQSVVDRLGILRGIDVSLIGQNLWLIYKNTPYSDPEEGISAGNIQGYQGGAYPTTRTIGFNAKLRF